MSANLCKCNHPKDQHAELDKSHKSACFYFNGYTYCKCMNFRKKESTEKQEILKLRNRVKELGNQLDELRGMLRDEGHV